jgi:hypothetical protein
MSKSVDILITHTPARLISHIPTDLLARECQPATQPDKADSTDPAYILVSRFSLRIQSNCAAEETIYNSRSTKSTS